MQYILLFIYSTLLIGFIAIFILSLYNSIKYWVPQVWTFASDFKVMKKYFKKSKKFKLKWKKIVDLWSWTGKVIRFFDENFQMKATWYEIDLLNHFISKILNIFFSNNSKSIKSNYLEIDLNNFNFVYVYLFPELMKKIETKIWSDCNKWTIIISNAFKFKKHKPIKILFNNKWKEEVFLYKV
jgi:hypothetical protein